MNNPAQTLSIRRVVAIYAAGLVAGVQGALYLFDLFDDGVADWRSGAIAVAFVGMGVALIARTFRSHRDA